MNPHRRRFVPTGDELSPLGLGTVKFGRNQKVKNKGGDGFPLPSAAEMAHLLDLSLELGINVLDTAPAYGVSEEELGPLLETRRERFFLMTKCGEEFNGGQSHYDFSAEAVEKSLARSLRRLKTDRLDLVLVHCNRDDLNNLQGSDVFPSLARAKEKGLIRSFGASTYSLEAARYALEHSDAIMVTFNAEDQSQLPVMEEAKVLGKGVFVKKGLRQGFLDGGPEAAMKAVLGQGAVTSMIFGTLNPAHLQSNCDAATSVLGAPVQLG